MEQALDALDAAEDLPVTERVPAEQEAVQDFAEAIAEALADGFSSVQQGPLADAVASEANHYNKSDVKELIQDAVEERQGAGKKRLDELLREDLDRVEVVKTTDHKQGATYRWHFDPAGSAPFQVETRSGTDGRGHFS